MKTPLTILLIACSTAAQAVSFKEARDLFHTCFTNPPPSLVAKGDYLFHVFDSYPGMNEDETVMRDQHRILSNYIGKPDAVLSPFPKGMTERLTPLVSFKMPAFQSFTVERKYHDRDLRVVTAFEAAPIEAARQAAASRQPLKRSLADWADSLRTTLLSIEDDADRLRFLSQLGATRRILADLTTVRTSVPDVDFIALRNAEANWNGKDATREACLAMLKLDPVFAPAWRRLADLEAAVGDLPAALSAELAAGAVAPDVARVLSRVKAMDAKSGAEVWLEFGRLYELFQQEDLTFGGKAPFWRAVRGTAGRVAFVSVGRGVSDKGAFAQAKALFRPYKGKDVQRDLAKATELLVKSIEVDPSDHEKWRYYAAALRAAKRSREAALAYLQALSLDPADTIAAAELVLMYEALGLSKMAEGDSWWLLMTSPDDASVKRVTEFVRGRHKDVFAE